MFSEYILLLSPLELWPRCTDFWKVADGLCNKLSQLNKDARTESIFSFILLRDRAVNDMLLFTSMTFRSESCHEDAHDGNSFQFLSLLISTLNQSTSWGICSSWERGLVHTYTFFLIVSVFSDDIQVCPPQIQAHHMLNISSLYFLSGFF